MANRANVQSDHNLAGKEHLPLDVFSTDHSDIKCVACLRLAQVSQKVVLNPSVGAVPFMSAHATSDQHRHLAVAGANRLNYLQPTRPYVQAPVIEGYTPRDGPCSIRRAWQYTFDHQGLSPRINQAQRKSRCHTDHQAPWLPGRSVGRQFGQASELPLHQLCCCRYAPRRHQVELHCQSLCL